MLHLQVSAAESHSFVVTELHLVGPNGNDGACMKAICVLALCLLDAAWAGASPITLPASLAPGSSYRLIFVTDGTHDSLSANIADYDAFVTAQANLDPTLAALGTTWQALASTPTVNAISHINLGTTPSFNLGGIEVASGQADMFDGSLDAPIGFDQHGLLLAPQTIVFTGTLSNGTTCCTRAMSQDSPEEGRSGMATVAWIDDGFGNPSQSRPFYGVSGTLVVPQLGPVPEPATVSLVLGPTLLMVSDRLRRRRRRVK
jgi:hypothetical protein